MLRLSVRLKTRQPIGKNVKHILLTILLIVFPVIVHANCNGTDRRPHLSAEQRAMIEGDRAKTPFSTGNHWIAQKGDRTLHVIGTFHLNDTRLDPIVRRLEPLIAAADVVMFEITVADQKAFEKNLAKDFSPALITSGPTLIEMMSPDAWGKLAKHANAAEVPAWMAAKMRPWFLTFALAIPPCMKRQKESAVNGLDRRLTRLAEKYDVPQVSLETIEQALNMFEKYPLQRQVEMLETSIAMLGATSDDLATSAAAYFEESAFEAVTYSKIVFYEKVDLAPAEMDRIWSEGLADLLDHRNLAWMPEIQKQDGQNIVVAVGAAHLPGESGLLALLEQQGYSLLRAPF